MTIKTYLSKMCEFCGLDKQDFNIDIEETAEKMQISLSVAEDKAGYFIGFKGETLSAIEYLLRIVFKDDSDKKFILDVNDYKKQKEDKLREQVVKLAAQVVESGQVRKLYGLNSYERYLVHSMLTNEAEFANLESLSEDDMDGSRVLMIRTKTN